jgi:predicted nucleic acid-binding protein
MRKKILDTSILISHWRRRWSEARRSPAVADVRRWARELIDLYNTDAIVTPVYVEMLAGITSRQHLQLTRAFLSEFQCIDEAIVPPADWVETIRLAQRVSTRSRPRDLGDCLIRAIANRLRHDVMTFDTGFAG